MKWSIFCLTLLAACNESGSQNHTRVEQIPGRLSEMPLYQAVIPEDWERIADETPRHDTKNPLASWKKQDVLITFHNFSPEINIPPSAQVSRWKNQWAPLDHEETAPDAHGGFGGFRLEAYQKERGLIAFAFQMNATLQQKIQRTPLREGKADWTLKAVGPAVKIQELADEIDRIANQIELIEPIL